MEFPTEIKNLVFSGGSIKGIAYPSAIAACERLNLLEKVENVGGTSAGAITALFLALGYNAKEILGFLAELDLLSLFDDENSSVKKKKLFNFKTTSSSNQSSTASQMALEVSRNFGLYPGNKLRQWLENKIQQATLQPNCTFKELQEFVSGKRHLNIVRPNARFRNLRIVGFNVNTQSPMTFSFETTPNVIISDAIRISAGFPFLFSPWKLFIKDNSGVRTVHPDYKDILWIDGGISQNYPITLFDNDKDIPNNSTLGFCLTSDKQKSVYEGQQEQEPKEIKTAYDYIVSILESALYNTAQRNERAGECYRTIYISHLDISTFAFNLNDNDKNALIQSGWNAIRNCNKFVDNDLPEVCPLLLPTI